MSKAILISIKPKYVAKILNGEKTIEIRKTMPKCELPIEVYIYCSKESGLLKLGNNPYFVKGKVVAKFTLNKCQEWHNYSWQEITSNGCVSDDELKKYANGRESLYIWHIDNLEIFEKPIELKEFYKYGVSEWIHNADKDMGYNQFWNCVEDFRLVKAPQSWCYVEELE